MTRNSTHRTKSDMSGPMMLSTMVSDGGNSDPKANESAVTALEAARESGSRIARMTTMPIAISFCARKLRAFVRKKMLKTLSMLENRLAPPQSRPAKEMRASGPVMCTRLLVSRLTMFIDQSLENFCAKVLIVFTACSFHATRDPGLPCTYTMHNPCRDRCVYRGPDGCVRSDGDA